MRALSAAVLLLLMGTAHAEHSREQLKSTLADLAKSKEAEAALKQKLEATARDMEKMRERAAALAENLQATEQRVSNEEEALDKANTELTLKRQEFEARKDDYTATVLSMLRMRNMPATAIFTSHEDTQKLLRTASVLEKTNSAVASKAARLRSDIAQMKKLQSTAKARDASTRAEKAKLKAEQDKLAKELANRQKLQKQLSADHAKAEARVAELSRSSKSLQELIDKLAADRKAEPPRKQTAKLREFDTKKGSGRAPVAGEILHRFGEKQGDNGTYRGMVFKARPGATVVAPYDGEVAFTGPFRDYGNMVLIKHKNGYISLIAGLGNVNTRLNQAAIRGEPIGTMPENGKAEAYVELRDASAKPIDPANWFANVVSKSAQQ
jgi:septal ring factor EnvC (AmiA/AmiB activator)